MQFMTSAGNQDIYTKVFTGVPKEVAEALLKEPEVKDQIDYYIKHMKEDGYTEDDFSKGKLVKNSETDLYGIKDGLFRLPLDMGKVLFIELDDLYDDVKDYVWRLISNTEFPIAEEFINVETLVNDIMSDFSTRYNAKLVEGQGEKMFPEYFDKDNIQIKTKNYFIACDLY